MEIYIINKCERHIGNACQRSIRPIGSHAHLETRDETADSPISDGIDDYDLSRSITIYRARQVTARASFSVPNETSSSVPGVGAFGERVSGSPPPTPLRRGVRMRRCRGADACICRPLERTPRIIVATAHSGFFRKQGEHPRVPTPGLSSRDHRRALVGPSTPKILSSNARIIIQCAQRPVRTGLEGKREERRDRGGGGRRK